MLTRNLRQNMMDAMDKIDKAAEKIADLTENNTEDLIFKAQIVGQLVDIYSGLKTINSILLTDALTSIGKEQV